MSGFSVRKVALFASCLAILSCDSSTDTQVAGMTLQLSPADRQITSLDGSRFRVEIVVNNGFVQTFFVEPNQSTIDASVTNVRRNETNTIEIKWFEILNGYDVQISEQIHTFVSNTDNVSISAPHTTNQFDYDGDGRSNRDERNNGTCVWSANESCLAAGQSDVPADVTSDPASLDELAVGENGVVNVENAGQNVLLNGDFSDGVQPFYNNIGSMQNIGGVLCFDLPAGPGSRRTIVEYLHLFNLERGTYIIEYDAMSSHAGKTLTTSMWQRSTNLQPHYDFVSPTTLDWERKRSVYTNNGDTLTAVNLAISAAEDETETVTYCFDNYTFYKQ